MRLKKKSVKLIQQHKSHFVMPPLNISLPLSPWNRG